MNSVAIWLNEEGTERVQRKIIRDQSDVLKLSDKRLSKDAFIYVLNSISTRMKSARRSTAVPDIIKLAAALKFLGQGGYQHQLGQDRFLGLAQQTMSRCLFEVCCAIESELCVKHISFKMSETEKRNAKRHFFEKSGIPGVIGAVDGTHIQLIRPAKNEHLFFNRKLKHSVNAMVICDHQMYIRAVNGRFGGASHDSHVWHLSGERRFLSENFENGDKGTWILGDSGYPLEPWLMTPYRNAPENSPESFFNDQFSKVRSIIERTFGVLKGRFRCLLAARELHYAPEKVVQILNVCCALHNICLLYKVEEIPLPYDEAEDSDCLYAVSPENSSITNTARIIRDNIKNSLVS